MSVRSEHAWLRALSGRFIAFEGPDGCGKSTQLKRLVALCQSEGLRVCEVREPGGTDAGERIRGILLDKSSSGMSLRCEMLLFMASRAQLVETRIRPALASGEVVFADRFVASTYAYQGAGGGLEEADITAVAAAATHGTMPDLNLVFDVDEQTAAKRAGIIAHGKNGERQEGSLFADRMEDRDAAFRRRVRESYLAQAKKDPARFGVVDARGGPDEVWALTLEKLRARFGTHA